MMEIESKWSNSYCRKRSSSVLMSEQSHLRLKELKGRQVYLLPIKSMAAIIAFLLMVAFGTACETSTNSQLSETPPLNLDSDAVFKWSFSKQPVYEYEGLGTEVAPPTEWSVSKINAPHSTSLGSILFLDEANGWVGGEGEAYETRDSGRSWQTVKLPVAPGFIAKYIKFSDKKTGWIVLQRMEPQGLFDNSFTVVSTKDGGKSWNDQVSRDGVSITGVETSDNTLLLVGIEYLKPNRGHGYRSLILGLQSDGKWNDLSDTLPGNTSGKEQGISGLFVETSQTVTVVTTDAHVFDSRDNGFSWQLRGGYDGSSDPVRSMGMTDSGALWIIEGSKGIEGIGSRLLTLPMDTESKEGTIIGLPGYFVKSASWVKSRGLLIVATRTSESEHSDSSFLSILHTPDLGKTWNTVFQKLDTDVVDTTILMNSRVLMVLCHSGVIYRISLK